jgi:ABC-type multidrug transport system fused ATPase/permease subunit
LALARVLLVQSPPVLILDEATSALDPANERRVLRALREGGRTVVLVAHRPAALRAADRVLVLVDGRLVEDGSCPGPAALDSCPSVAYLPEQP